MNKQFEIEYTSYNDNEGTESPYQSMTIWANNANEARAKAIEVLTKNNPGVRFDITEVTQ